MLYKNFLILFLIMCTNLSAQEQIFDVKKNSSDSPFFITYYGKSLYFDSNYTFSLKINDTINKLILIEKLLEFEGDDRILNISPRIVHNPMVTVIYSGKVNSCSVQVYALFLINYIYYGDFWYSSYPVLVDKENNMEEACQGELVDLAYKNYKKWFKKELKRKSKSKKYRAPLKGCRVQWY